jgi:hypothetical protein
MSVTKAMRFLTIGFILFISNVGLSQNIDQSKENQFVANGRSENLIPSEAKLNMLHDARLRCQIPCSCLVALLFQGFHCLISGN